MKFETTVEQLNTAVATSTRFTDKRPNLPVLATILLIAEQGRLLLRATNLECGIEITVPAKVLQEGIAAVPAHTLSSFLSTLKGKQVSVFLKDHTIQVETDHMVASIKTLPPEDFPTLPRVAASTSFSVKSIDLIKAIRSVGYCASTSSIKPELQSVLLSAEAGKLTVAATDSFRLAEKTILLRSRGSVPRLLFPARNAMEFIRLLETHNGDVDVYYNENQISAHINNTYFTSRLIDGSFPNYQQIIPKSFTTEVVVLREDLSQALKSLSVFSDKFFHIILAVEPAKKTLVLSSHNPDVGEQISTLRATIVGEAISMSFNGRYVADSLQSIAGESVRIHANGTGKAIVMKDASDESFLYLVMPMNR